jgi:hypothetical protein
LKEVANDLLVTISYSMMDEPEPVFIPLVKGLKTTSYGLQRLFEVLSWAGLGHFTQLFDVKGLFLERSVLFVISIRLLTLCKPEALKISSILSLLMLDLSHLKIELNYILPFNSVPLEGHDGAQGKYASPL